MSCCWGPSRADPTRPFRVLDRFWGKGYVAGFGFPVGVPGMSVRVSTRAVRSSIGPHAARLSVGSGGARMSTGAALPLRVDSGGDAARAHDDLEKGLLLRGVRHGHAGTPGWRLKRCGSGRVRRRLRAAMSAETGNGRPMSPLWEAPGDSNGRRPTAVHVGAISPTSHCRCGSAVPTHSSKPHARSPGAEAAPTSVIIHTSPRRGSAVSRSSAAIACWQKGLTAHRGRLTPIRLASLRA